MNFTQKELEKPALKHKKAAAGIIFLFCTLLFIYLGMAKYFMRHLYPGSAVNSVDVSWKTIKDADELMMSEVQNYTLNLKERGGKSEQIKANDIGLKYNSGEKLKGLKDSQKPYKWILEIFNSKDYKITTELSYDDELLKKRIDRLSCFDSSNIIEPKNPSFKYENGKYVIVDEVLGNKVDKKALYSNVVNTILKKQNEINLDTAGCYVNPKYNSKSQEIIAARDILNRYAASKITYTFGKRKEILDGSTINKWLSVNNNFNVILDEGKLKDYVAALSDTYSTVGKTRKFVTSSGETINIDGGDYGWSIDTEKEAQDLIVLVREGKTTAKEPAYDKTALFNDNNDIGNTYVEIDLTKQHLWFYKDGSLIVQGDVVTGNVSSNHTTPEGVYRLKYRERDAVLKGADYASPVDFWMPFNGGIGIHDASWRSEFGGNIYKTNGSHGCINCPYNVAKAVFNNIEAGTAVVCHW